MRLTRLLPALAVLAAFSSPALAAEATVTGDLFSAYVWRGLTFAKGPVFQPTLEVSGVSLGEVPLSATVWGNFNLDDWDGQLEQNSFSEVDFTLNAELPKGFSVGLIEYVFTVGEPSTRELTLGWSKEYSLLTPTVTFAYDFGQLDSGFLLLGAERELPLGERAALTLSGEVGYAGEGFALYYGGEKGGFYHYGLTAAVSLKLGEKGAVSGKLGYTGSFDETILRDQEVSFWGGVSLSYSF